MSLQRPFGRALSFEWSGGDFEELLDRGRDGLRSYYALHDIHPGPPRESWRSDFDGAVLVPNLARLDHVGRAGLLMSLVSAMERMLRPRWMVHLAMDDPFATEAEEFWHWPQADLRSSQEDFHWVSVQLARRNYNRTSFETSPLVLSHPREVVLDPIAGLLAIFQLAVTRSVMPMHVITPGLMYSPGRNGRFTDVTRIDLEPPRLDPKNRRPGIITLDWNWANPNRARPNYNVGTMLIHGG